MEICPKNVFFFIVYMFRLKVIFHLTYGGLFMNTIKKLFFTPFLEIQESLHIEVIENKKQGTNVAHNIMGGLQIIAMFHL